MPPTRVTAASWIGAGSVARGREAARSLGGAPAVRGAESVSRPTPVPVASLVWASPPPQPTTAHAAPAIAASEANEEPAERGALPTARILLDGAVAAPKRTMTVFSSGIRTSPHPARGMPRVRAASGGRTIPAMRLPAAILSAALVLLVPATALGSVSAEQRQGQALLNQLRSGTKICAQLSSGDLDHLGEFAIGQMLGSTRLHAAMNERMTLMLGATGERRMHQIMGARYAGCHAAGATGAYGGMMMGGSSPSTYGWMMRGNWRTMSRADWQRVAHRWLGAPMMSTATPSGTSALAIAGIAAGALLLAGIAFGAVRHFRRPHGA